MEKRIHRAGEMNRLAAEMLSHLEPRKGSSTIFALSGELGAGKTTFAQAIAKALEVEETVNSPTFVIEKIYSLASQRWQRLVHIDAYRLKSADELRTLGWDELVADPNNLIVIEWPENVSGAIPETAHTVRIEIEEGEARTLQYSGLRNP